MKRLPALLLAVLFLVSFAACASASSASGKITLTITTKDPSSGAPLPKVGLSIWRVESVDKGTFEECVKEFKTNSLGQKTVTLAPGSYRILVASAPKGYAEFTETNITLKKDRAVSVNVLPLLSVRFKVLDHEGNPVPQAEVSAGYVSACSSQKGIANVQNVEYGKNLVRVVVTKGLERYVAYEQKKTLKAAPGAAIRKTIKLLPPEDWQKIEYYYVAKKPILYLYSKEPRLVNVRLGHPESLTVSYPLYDPASGWTVTVRPDGLLTDESTGRTLYSLYWESLRPRPAVRDTGFVVAGDEAAAFLEEKLAFLGLSDREAQEFIVFWLPQLQQNPWNYIRFATELEIDAVMPLSVTPAPEKVLRVWMEFTPLSEKVELPPQPLTRVDRESLNASDFYAVEWGGTGF